MFGNWAKPRDKAIVSLVQSLPSENNIRVERAVKLRAQAAADGITDSNQAANPFGDL